jgi:hypothetical protein
MGAYIMLGYVGILCLAAVIYLFTPSGKKWLEQH